MKSVLCCAAILIGGCGTRTCKDQTVLVSLSLGDAAAQADRFDVTVVVGGSQTLTATGLPRTGSSTQGTLEIQFPKSYPSKQMIVVTVTALNGAAVLGSGTNHTTLDAACATLSIAIGAPDDLSVPAADLSAADLSSSGADLSAIRDLAMAPRPDLASPPCALVPGSDAYVSSGTSGTDDPAHGGGVGPCGFRTITYALQHATDTIHVSTGLYSSQETFPLILTGNQKLVCDMGAQLSGAGTGTQSFTIMMKGQNNAVSACILQNGASASSGIGVVSAGLTNRVVSISQNEFHNYGIGIEWRAESDASGALRGNSFHDDSISDVDCSASTAALLGSQNSSNTPDAGPGLYCNGCSNCLAYSCSCPSAQCCNGTACADCVILGKVCGADTGQCQ